MPDKVILITGATDGIGREAVLELGTRGGWHVLVHGRSKQKVDEVCGLIAASGGSAKGFTADLSSLSQVKGLAQDVLAHTKRLDVLVNNAGVFMKDRVLSADGFEMSFAVNHLAHFLLTLSLLDVLKASAPSRVVTVSSVAHNRGKLDFDDLQMENDFSGYGAYAASKLANVLFSNELARRLAGTGVESYSLHPGVIATKLLKEGFPGASGVDVADGHGNLLFVATDPSLQGKTGKYFSDLKEVNPAAHALDLDSARHLWKKSQELVKPFAAGLPLSS
ncbi:MAG: SDR family oxidoreductase [Spirochaetia bacterium]|nr:SDR family oxidoreductase [Spirochaetia bacterium]